MSLLGTPVFGNPTTPIWLGVGGGTISGSLQVDGNVQAGRFGASKVLGGPNFGNFALVDASGNTIGGLNQLGTPGASDVNITTQPGQKVVFGTVGNNTGGNTSLTVSAQGANLDLLTVGGTVDALALKLQNTGGAPVVGTATLSGGTFTVSTTACDVTSYILLTRGAINASTAIANLRVSNKSANQFTVVSARDASPTTTETGDASTFDWMIINPA